MFLPASSSYRYTISGALSSNEQLKGLEERLLAIQPVLHLDEVHSLDRATQSVSM